MRMRPDEQASMFKVLNSMAYTWDRPKDRLVSVTRFEFTDSVLVWSKWTPKNTPTEVVLRVKQIKKPEQWSTCQQATKDKELHLAKSRVLIDYSVSGTVSCTIINLWSDWSALAWRDALLPLWTPDFSRSKDCPIWTSCADLVHWSCVCHFHLDPISSKICAPSASSPA